MTFGTGPWGTTPWGGGLPSVGGNVFIDTVRYITPTYIRLQLDTQVIVNSHYTDVTNFTVTLRSDTPVPGDAVAIVRVIVPALEALVVDYVYLVTTPFTEGATYDVSFSTLNTVDGVPTELGSTVPVQARVTKTMQMLKSLPAHFDKRVDSLLHAVVSAISMQDDTIGGSRNDEFP